MSGISFWRVAGLSYNQYTAVATAALKKVLKPDAAKTRKIEVTMKERTFTNGQPGERSEIKDIFSKSIFANKST